ncbi:alpha,alpha-trehalose-phosphate synthase [UDP-forming] 1-like [Senna tora]|uniref:alpha,alpha-trehalose-phosphate synthase (UDP-forming) n=1 Tax=Senna tora TaxID=362788 RepID=A0A834SIZ9_9FABA|nr:alpha,alpha-trehalose-phosphate synthase [UDP-forming] 1-like [Senna tora]
MPGSNYNCSPSPTTPRSRLERLLREREIRKSNKYFLPTEEARDGYKELEQLYSDFSAGENNIREEEVLEKIAALRLSERFQNQEERPSKQRLLVVANRLPVSAIRRGVKEFDTRWIGWAGVNVPDDVGQKALIKALAEKRCIPVFLDEEIVHQYYNGYCNNILWPLFHYLGLPQEDRLATTRSFQSQFDAYKIANQMFADVVNKHYEEGDVVWCHDYHLMFLPKCLKEHNKKMKVGWFLHTPFPSSEIHRTLPSRSELLRSVLAADLVGFHTYDYARHFVSACTRILGLEGTPEGVEDHGKLTRVAAFPIGIDSERFIRALELPQVQDHIRELKERFGGRKVMLGVDRLDMIKGIPQKILAFEKFLEENPDWHDKVVLLQIAVPTRTDVAESFSSIFKAPMLHFRALAEVVDMNEGHHSVKLVALADQRLTSQVHEIVGRINGRFGTLTAVPIHHLDRSLDFHALCALYAVTGAAQSLGAGAVLVNPWNITEVAASIAYALNMPADEREKRHQFNFKHVTTHTSQEWAATFVSELNDTIVEAQLRTRQVPPLLPNEAAVHCYSISNNRLIILPKISSFSPSLSQLAVTALQGFNNTLTEPVDALGRGGQIRELDLKLHPNLKDPLKKLSDDPKTTVVVLSGSDRGVLDKNFSEYNMWLAAENGMFLRLTTGEWMTTMPENLNMDWVDSVKQVFEYFTERTPRSHFEMRETSIVWNYKYADVEFGRIQARDLLQHLWTGPISNALLEVVQGGRSVEVRAVGVSKGAAIDRILGEIVHHKGMKAPIDYVLCVGHFLPKDEDVYTFFEPELPSETPLLARGMLSNSYRPSLPKFSTSKTGLSKAARLKKQLSMSTLEKRGLDHATETPWRPTYRDRISLQEGSSVLDLKGDNYFSCAVARKSSSARYLLKTSNNVVDLLKDLSDHASPPST